MTKTSLNDATPDDWDKIGTAIVEPSMVESPPHYNQGDVEAIDAIRSALGPSSFIDYCRANALKYTWRMQDKGKPLEDCRKALWYLEKVQEELQRV